MPVNIQKGKGDSLSLNDTGSAGKKPQDPHKEYEGEKDYPIPSNDNISDRYEIFETRIPFKRTHLKRFMEAVDKAATESGNKGFITVIALSKQLKTDAWKDLTSTHS